MTDNKMLQAILDKIVNLEKNIREDIARLDKKVDGIEERLTNRIDMLGKQLAILDDDAPSGKEFKALEKRVTKLESKSASFSS